MYASGLHLTIPFVLDYTQTQTVSYKNENFPIKALITLFHFTRCEEIY